MDKNRFKRLRDLFVQTAKLPIGERRAWLDTHCADDPSLADEVLDLLSAATESGSAIDDIVDEAAADYASGLPEGERIGPYRILGTLGRGGMGQVYLAERADDEFRQQVAIKTVGWLGASPEVVNRFRTERQILADLQHPYIARLLDGGQTANGTPYLVMEYVDGKPITDWCREHAQSLEQRLLLFTRVCEAVRYAHRKLIIHRDIKPSNILVDGDGNPRLLDFGIAKLIDPGDDRPFVTRADRRVLTPEYASPEQVRGEPATISTDVYGLGLLLYEMLTGRFPYDVADATSPQLADIICNTEPAAPSTAVIQDDAGSNAIPNAAQLARTLRGDLDNIVMMAMRKEPERRYETVGALAGDVDNYLEQRPVLAREDSASYRVGKFLRRNRTAAIATAVVIAAVATQTAIYTQRLAAERDRAQLQADRAEQVAGFMTDLFAEADPTRNLGEPMTARQMLDAGAERVASELTSQPELQAALMVTIAQSYENMEENLAAHEYLQAALPELESKLGPDHPEVLRLRYLEGIFLAFVGEMDAAKDIHEENLARHTALHGAKSYESARELKQLAYIDSVSGEHVAAEEKFIEVLELFRALGDRAEVDVSRVLLDYGGMLRLLDREEEEAEMLHEALDIKERHFGTGHPEYAAVINNLGNNYYRRGELERAREYMEQHVELQRTLNGEASVPYGVALVNYATLIHEEGEKARALELYEEGLAIYARGYGTDAPRYAYLLENIANTQVDLDLYEEAEKSYLEALAILGERFGTDHPEYAFTQYNWGVSLGRMGRQAEAVPELRSVVAIWTESHGADYSRTVRTRVALAENLLNSGQPEAAREEALASLEVARDIFSENDLSLLFALRVTAKAHRNLEDYESANPLFDEALGVAKKLETQRLTQIIITEIDYAKSLAAEGRQDAARQLLQTRRSGLSAEDDHDGEYRESIDEAMTELAL